MSPGARLLVDAREFVPGRFTGIGRVLAGLAEALADSPAFSAVTLAASCPEAVPATLAARAKVSVRPVPAGFLRGEWAMSRLAAGHDVFLSPYPKLPLFGVRCRAVHIIHDVHNITHGAYAGTLRARFDRLRLGRALRRADMTWYDSEYSRAQTEALAGTDGRDARVRHPGLGSFSCATRPGDEADLARLGLAPGYVLALGNGLPHKNLGVLLARAGEYGRPLVLAGCPPQARERWEREFPGAGAVWLGFLSDEDMKVVLRGAFCLVLPSQAEGYGYPPLEAMACGVPAVVSDIAVLREVCAGAALTVDPASPGDWVRAVGSLEDAAVREPLVRAGLRRAAELSGPAAWAPCVADMEELLGREGGL